MLSKEPVRIRHNWDAAVVAICDFCSHSEMTVPHIDGGKICSSCCDAETLSKWQSYAQDVVSELLSLREQLAELKALEPVAWQSVSTSSCNRMVTLHKEMAKDWERKGFAVMPLFTAAKPAGLDVEDITEFMRKAFWRGFESARGTENSNIPEHWKDSKPNLLLALKAKISGA
ncbi:TPA: hypothetical protein PXQ51_002246 [Yersinia enterocolitica]|nr:hypothetical protein [Yersinia enterocolitica]